MSEGFRLVQSPISPGLSLIESSAGTGKTTAISNLVPRLLLEKQVDRISELALVTFTNDAAAELVGKVRKKLEVLAGESSRESGGKELPGVRELREAFPGEESRQILRRALREIDELSVSTIHSFCQRILQSEGTLCGFPVMPELQPEAGALIEVALRDLWEEEVVNDPAKAGLAAACGLSIEGDAWQVGAWMKDEGAEFRPSPKTLDQATREIWQTVGAFRPEWIEELRGIFSRVQGWNRAAVGEEEREGIFRRLASYDPSAAGEFFLAAGRLAGAGEWIARKGKEGKALAEAAGESALVRWCGSLNEPLRQWAWAWKVRSLERVRREVREQLRHGRLITYDGLIEEVWQALRGPQGEKLAGRLRRRYRVAIIDESQDTDARQMEIFQRIFLSPEAKQSGHRLILIGDPKQAIYAFRGADVNTYLQAKNWPGARTFVLNTTYRAPGPLVGAINAVFARPGSFLKEGLDFSPAESGLVEDWELVVGGVAEATRLEFWLAPDLAGEGLGQKDRRLRRIAGTVAEEIASLLERRARLRRGGEEREVRPADFAVLVSDHQQGAALEEALRECGVPSVQAASESIYHSEEAAEFLVVLRALQRPQVAGLRRAALATRLLGFSAEDLVDLENRADGESRVAAGFLRWREVQEREGLGRWWTEMDRDLAEWKTLYEVSWVRLGRGPDGERRLTNLRHLLDLLQEAESNGARRAADLRRWLEREMRQAGRGEEENPVRLESDVEAVKISTMHAAKGLEYPLVFCPFLWSARDPADLVKRQRPGFPPEWVELDLLDGAEREEVLAEVERTALEDRLRLAYVALTRAQVKVWVVGGQVSGVRGNPTCAAALDWLLREDGQEYSREWSRGAWSAGRGSRQGAGVAALQRGLSVIGCRDLPELRGVVWRPERGEEAAPIVFPQLPEIPAAKTVTSFSALTRESHPHGEPGSGEVFAPSEEEKAGRNSFAQAPGGTSVGTMLHDWLERWDFGELDRGVWELHWSSYALPEAPDEVWQTKTVEMLEALRSAVLPEWGCEIHEACPQAVASEWHFQLPIRWALGPQELAAVFARHGQEDYARLLSQLAPAALRGYLQGFLDRLAVWRGVWGVIDWKTNKLAGGYGLESLQDCAWSSHYWLQAHLYLVALRRLRGAAGVGPAWLIFLRGIKGGTSEGILPILPKAELLEDLAKLF